MSNVLVIDDEPQIRRFLRAGFELHGYTVIEAKDATAGLKAAIFEKPDIIVLDLNLPDLDGSKVLERIRSWSTHHFLRDALFNQPDKNQGACWHRPVIVRDMQTRLGDVIGRLKVVQERPDDDVIDNDLILIWGPQKRIITGSDLLGRLLRGIATVEAGNAAQRLARP
jgi:CheY-like chemotaxis protein